MDVNGKATCVYVIAPLLSEVSIDVGTDTQLSLLDVRIWQPYGMRVTRCEVFFRTKTMWLFRDN